MQAPQPLSQAQPLLSRLEAHANKDALHFECIEALRESVALIKECADLLQLLKSTVELQQSALKVASKTKAAF
jgi:hypothetical protein